ncbi:14649_t:CDS:1, partial [Racocetra persica]
IVNNTILNIIVVNDTVSIDINFSVAVNNTTVVNDITNIDEDNNSVVINIIFIVVVGTVVSINSSLLD